MEVLSSFYPYIDPTNKLQPRIFGCVSFVHVHSNGREKLDTRAFKFVFCRILNHTRDINAITHHLKAWGFHLSRSKRIYVVQF